MFNPITGQFIEVVYTLTHDSFVDDLVIIPRDEFRGIPGGFAAASFLDGRIVTVLNDGTVIQSNQGEFLVSPETGIYQADYNPELIGANPITYRVSNDRLYSQGFDTTNIYMLDWRGSTPVAIPLDPPTNLEGFAFGPDDLLYSPDIGNNQIVTVNVDTGIVTPIEGIPPIIFPVDLKVDNNGILYFLERPTGNVYQYNPVTKELKILATLAPALEKVGISPDQKKLYVSNDENKLVQVDIETGATQTLFDSPIIQPWHVAYDADSDTLYVADTGSIKQFNRYDGSLIHSLVIDSTASGLLGTGQANGIDVEQGPDAKIVLCDITLGNVFVLNKQDLSVYLIISSGITNLFGKQPFSAVRLTSPTEYYLIADSVDGTILQFNPVTNQVTTFIQGLNTPVKLKVNNGYLYVVEAGQLLEGIPNTGRISRFLLSDPSQQHVLIDHLNNPQGLDIYQNTLLTVEVGKKRLLAASAVAPSQPEILVENLDLSNDLLISQYNPIPIDPTVSVAIDAEGKHAYINVTQPNNITEYEVSL